MTVPVSRSRRNLGVLALLTIGTGWVGAPLWTLVVLTLTCLMIPIAVGLHGGPALVRTLLLGDRRPGRGQRVRRDGTCSG
ncbi:hypothetical protein I0C86_21910 [Plantactinospora sp. S1510]|uniref:Uncharacterized protein n=1 Tax=Plantactinospora alkalitolerans TaxID=2789879 RepID=A0ABS0GZG0_9ACTN|nr:hypothetical protein [Plantactinospora alkalitolerans]MBF9131599.1 hypothetical protein [Plantactinospora alkalitolerans]